MHYVLLFEGFFSIKKKKKKKDITWPGDAPFISTPEKVFRKIS